MHRLLLLFFLIPAQLVSQELPHFAVSPTAMNVVYRGMENPIEIAVSGVQDSNTIVQFSNVEQAIKKDEKWLVKPGRGQTVIVTVSQLIDENIIYVGKKEFRVKNVPDPKPYFGSKTGTNGIEYINLSAAAGVIAKMENFEFDLRFKILSYDFLSDTGAGPILIHCEGAAIHPDTRKVRWRLKHGGEVTIKNIMAIGPDSIERRLEDIRLYVIPKGATDMRIYDAKNSFWVAWSVYRSGQPTKAELSHMSNIGGKNILNLRRINMDKRRSKELDLNIHHMSIKTRKMKESDLVDALDFIDDTHYNTVIHCKHGADRTGAVIAAYRVIYNNWSKASAIEEMRSPKFGYHEKLFPNLVELIENLDVEGIRNELGVNQ